jgi:prepilin-type processing-associated H-X9-DG protein
MLRILPYIEQGTMTSGLSATTNIGTFFSTLEVTNVNMFGCPSDPRTGKNGSGFTTGGTATSALTSYVGITGNNETATSATSGFFDGTNGIFQTTGPGIRITDITDGTSNTMAVAERPPASDLYWGWWAWSDFDNSLGYPNRTLTVGGCDSQLPGYFRSDKPDNPCAVEHIWSLHTGGGNFLLGDGSVRFMSYNGATTTLVGMASYNGNEVVNPDSP